MNEARETDANLVFLGRGNRVALEQVRELLMLIGPEWLACAEGTTVRLVDDEVDWVRREVRRALERSIEIIPVLFDRAAMPTDLPDDVAELSVRQAATVRHTSLNADLARLAERIVDRVPELALPDLFSARLTTQRVFSANVTRTSSIPAGSYPCEPADGEYRGVPPPLGARAGPKHHVDHALVVGGVSG